MSGAMMIRLAKQDDTHHLVQFNQAIVRELEDKELL